MNVLKAQQEILKALVAGDKVAWCKDFITGAVLVSTNGVTVYNIPPELLFVNLSSAELTEGLRDLANVAITPENLLIATDEYRVGGTVRKYVRACDRTQEVYVDTKAIKNFTLPTLYQDPTHPWSPVLVTERELMEDEILTVGVVAVVNLEE